MSADAVIKAALDCVGTPYVWNAATPGKGMDCSGLTLYAYKKGANITLPHFTGAQWTKGTRVSRKDMKPGDLVFPSPSHVGIYLGNNKLVHAPTFGQNVKVENLWAFWGARRLIAPGTAVTEPTTPGKGTTDNILPVGNVVTDFKDAAKLALWLTDEKNWFRIAMFFAGFVLCAFALIRINFVKSGAQTVVKGVKRYAKP